MSDVSGRPTLAEYLSFAALAELAEKRLLRGYEVPMLPFLIQGLIVFSEGVILGRARRERLETLGKMFVGFAALREICKRLGLPSDLASDERWVVQYLSKVAQDGMQYYGKAPESLLDYLLTSFAPPDLDFRGVENMRRLRKRKVPLETAIQQAGSWALAGVSFGATSPDLAGRLLNNVYGPRDPLWWAELRRSGVTPPDQDAFFSSEHIEGVVLSLVALYARDHFPELMEPLGLGLN